LEFSCEIGSMVYAPFLAVDELEVHVTFAN
jgi:hypothetical protein